MNESKSVRLRTPRRRPIILLADISDSMSLGLRTGDETKIAILNRCVRTLLQAFAAADTPRVNFTVAVVTFGGYARIALPLTLAAEARWSDLGTQGGTPLGAALAMVSALLRDPAAIAERDHDPVIVLASDGRPTDHWQEPLQRLEQAPRARKADRFAIAIGDDADRAMLQTFLDPAIRSDQTEAKLFEAGAEAAMVEAFRQVSQSSIARAMHPKPGGRPPDSLSPAELL